MIRRSVVIFSFMVAFVAAIYAAYVFWALSLGDKHGRCDEYARSSYPSPGAIRFAETVVKYCKDENRAEATVWLSSDGDYARSVSVFSSILSLSDENEIPANWKSPNFTVHWSGDAKLSIIFPSNMVVRSHPEVINDVTVGYSQLPQ
jgi:hypothetical protein